MQTRHQVAMRPARVSSDGAAMFSCTTPVTLCDDGHSGAGALSALAVDQSRRRAPPSLLAQRAPPQHTRHMDMDAAVGGGHTATGNAGAEETGDAIGAIKPPHSLLRSSSLPGQLSVEDAFAYQAAAALPDGRTGSLLRTPVAQLATGTQPNPRDDLHMCEAEDEEERAPAGPVFATRSGKRGATEPSSYPDWRLDSDGSDQSEAMAGGVAIDSLNMWLPEASIESVPVAYAGCRRITRNGPAVGAKAVCGKRPYMEDMYSVHMCLYRMPAYGCTMLTGNDGIVHVPDPMMPPTKVPPRLRSHLKPLLDMQVHGPGGGGSAADGSSLSARRRQRSLLAPGGGGGADGGPHLHEEFHFAGVFDGHGGDVASRHCASRMHAHLSDALASSAANGTAVAAATAATTSAATTHSAQGRSAGSDSSSDDCVRLGGDDPLPRHQRRADGRAHSHDEPRRWVAGRPARSTYLSAPFDRATAALGEVDHIEAALRRAFLETDAEFGARASPRIAECIGSTALVALVGNSTMWVANCGDSRAVLLRGGAALQLTDDHKPERRDETERVRQAGGQVYNWNGHRVMGVLAMSRAIGDHALRPYVIPEPEVTVVSRHPDDELLLLASDGLWDVFDIADAASLASRCVAKASARGVSRRAALRVSASVLAKAAIDRGSRDNVTVVVVDLATGKA